MHKVSSRIGKKHLEPFINLDVKKTKEIHLVTKKLQPEVGEKLLFLVTILQLELKKGTSQKVTS
jgi:hypothetical protein